MSVAAAFERDLRVFIDGGDPHAAGCTVDGIRLTNRSGSRIISPTRWKFLRENGFVCLGNARTTMFEITDAGRAVIAGLSAHSSRGGDA